MTKNEAFEKARLILGQDVFVNEYSWDGKDVECVIGRIHTFQPNIAGKQRESFKEQVASGPTWDEAVAMLERETKDILAFGAEIGGGK